MVRRPANDVLTGAIHLVRHGESGWNVERRVQGQAAAGPLSEVGRAQAAEVAEALAAMVGDVVLISSDLLRARQTGSVIAARLGIGMSLDPMLRERSFGELEGRPITEPDVRAEVDALWADPDHRVPGAETLREFYARIRDALLRLSAEHPGRDLVLSTHGGPIRVASAWAAGRPPEEVGFPPVRNGEIRTLPLPLPLPG